MNRSIRLLVASLAFEVWLWPAAAAAQAQDAAPPAPTLTVEHVRNSFSIAGYCVEPAQTWDWTSPPVTSFQVRDHADARVLMVLVYANATAAQTVRTQARAQEETQIPGSGASTFDSPHLVDGYGPPVWNGNVALVQTSQSELDRLFLLQNDRDTCMDVDPNLLREPQSPVVAVDVDFQHALNDGAVTL